MEPRQQAVERYEAGASVEDTVEAGTQFATASRSGSGAIRLEIIVEPPDQCAHALHVAQQPMLADAAPQCPFGGGADWIRCDLHCADAEAVEMRLPGNTGSTNRVC